MGQRNSNDPASSPIQSRGSGSSDNWPTQSDEDIDRWVAMHQSRGSFSSLGVSSKIFLFFVAQTSLVSLFYRKFLLLKRKLFAFKNLRHK